MNENAPTEQTQTALFAATLGDLFASRAETLWLHQAEMCGAKGDVVIVRQYHGELIPIGFLELAMETAKTDKVAQLFGYANNLTSTLGGKCPLFLGALVRERGFVQLCAYYAALSTDDPKKSLFADVLLYENNIGEGLATVFHCLHAWAALESHHLSAPVTWVSDTHFTNISFHSDRVFKLYDYRYRNVRPQDRRSPLLALECLPDAKLEAQWKDFEILSYAMIAGDHQLRSACQARMLAQKLDHFHQRGCILGDIRLRNIIFSTDGQEASFIDFDYSKNSGEVKQYPLGWVRDIDDGARHIDATESGDLMPIHDWFALASTFQFFQPSDPNERIGWEAAISSLLDGQLVSARENLSKDFILVPRSDKQVPAVPTGVGTGSPNRLPKVRRVGPSTSSVESVSKKRKRDDKETSSL